MNQSLPIKAGSLAVISILAGLSSGQADPITVNWTGPDNGSFTSPGNWSSGSVPGPNDSLVIANGTTAVYDGSTSPLTIYNLRPGENSGSSGTYTQTGGSLSITNNFVLVTGGANATGTANLNGGSLTVANITAIGNNNAGGAATLNINGANVTLQGEVTVGRQQSGGTINLAAGSLSLTAGSSKFFAVGAGSSGSRTANFNQTGGVLSISSLPSVIGSGTGNTSSWTASAGTANIGGEFQVGTANSTSSFALSGTADYTFNGALRVGYGGAANAGGASVSQSGGTLVANNAAYLGDGGVLSATWTATSGAAAFNNQLIVGKSTAASLDISGDASYTIENANANNELQIGVAGAGSVTLWGSAELKADIIRVGRGSLGTFTQTGGAVTVNSSLEIGQGGTGIWLAGGDSVGSLKEICIGRSSDGNMILSDNANYTATGAIELAYAGASSGTLILNGGTLTTMALATPFSKHGGGGTGAVAINFNGGTLRAGADSSDYFGNLDDEDLQIQWGGLIFDTNYSTVTIDNALGGDGGLTKQGGGTLILSGANTYAGNTMITEGTLVLTSASLNDAADVWLMSGTSLTLDFLGSDAINTLWLDGMALELGTWGSSASGAEHQDDSLFSGLGQLNVTGVPEPHTICLLILGGLGLLLGKRMNTLTATSLGHLLRWCELCPRKFARWRERYGKANEHNALVPRDHWLEPWEHQAIIDYARAHPLEGYRSLTFMMLDADVAAVAPSTTYRVLKPPA